MANIFPIEFTFSSVFALKHAECKIYASNVHSLHQLWHLYSLCNAYVQRSVWRQYDKQGGQCGLHNIPRWSSGRCGASSMQRLWQFALTAAAAALICCLNFLFVAATSLPVLCPLSLHLNCTHTSLK